ncbi:hypothetical protein H9P43_009962 [Blastocladiella emersonii ATCC 22665]|nr:hypothetical protein H9P43_009962 [Blastocladiella emersonii ATCC 22665]
MIAYIICTLASLAHRAAGTFVDVGPRSNLLFTPPPVASAPLALAGPRALRGVPRYISYDRTGQVLVFSESSASCSGSLMGVDVTVFNPTLSISDSLFQQSICDDSADVQVLSVAFDPANETVYVAYQVDESPPFINLDRFDALSGTVENIVSFNATSGQPFTLSSIPSPLAPSDGRSAAGGNGTHSTGNGRNATSRAVKDGSGKRATANTTAAGSRTTRLFASANEAVWYIQDGFVDLALLYPLGNTVVSSTSTVLPPMLRAADADADAPDSGGRLYAVVRSDADGSLYLHMQDAFDPLAHIYDVDLLTAAPARLYSPPPMPRLATYLADRAGTPVDKAPTARQALRVCGASVYLAIEHPAAAGGKSRLSFRTFSAVDLTEVATADALALDEVLDMECEAKTGNLLLLTRSTTTAEARPAAASGRKPAPPREAGPRESLVTLSPTLRIVASEPFGQVTKLAPDNSTSVAFRRIGLGLPVHGGSSVVTLLQSAYNASRPDLDAGSRSADPELLLAATASVDCLQSSSAVRSAAAAASAASTSLNATSVASLARATGGYLCAPCSLAQTGNAPGAMISQVGDTGTTCLFLRATTGLVTSGGTASDGDADAASGSDGGDGSGGGAGTSEPNSTECPPPYYYDATIGSCRFCTGEADGDSCRTVQEAGAANSVTVVSGVNQLIGLVAGAGALAGVLGGLMWHRRAVSAQADLERGVDPKAGAGLGKQYERNDSFMSAYDTDAEASGMSMPLPPGPPPILPLRHLPTPPLPRDGYGHGSAHHRDSILSTATGNITPSILGDAPMVRHFRDRTGTAPPSSRVQRGPLLQFEPYEIPRTALHGRSASGLSAHSTSSTSSSAFLTGSSIQHLLHGNRSAPAVPRALHTVPPRSYHPPPRGGAGSVSNSLSRASGSAPPTAASAWNRARNRSASHSLLDTTLYHPTDRRLVATPTSATMPSIPGRASLPRHLGGGGSRSAPPSTAAATGPNHVRLASGATGVTVPHSRAASGPATAIPADTSDLLGGGLASNGATLYRPLVHSHTFPPLGYPSAGLAAWSGSHDWTNQSMSMSGILRSLPVPASPMLPPAHMMYGAGGGVVNPYLPPHMNNASFIHYTGGNGLMSPCLSPILPPGPLAATTADPYSAAGGGGMWAGSVASMYSLPSMFVGSAPCLGGTAAGVTVPVPPPPARTAAPPVKVKRRY